MLSSVKGTAREVLVNIDSVLDRAFIDGIEPDSVV